MKYFRFVINYFIFILKYLYIKRIKCTDFPEIMEIEDTIDLIIEKKISVSRFGDGELNLLNPKWNIGFQKGDSLLSEKLKTTLLSNNPNCLICLPNALYTLKGYTIISKNFWMHHIINCYSNYSTYINRNRIYGNTQITRCYMDYKDKTSASKIFDKLKMIWDERDILIIEGQQTRLGIGNDLFSNAKSIKRIITLSKNAFSKLEELIKEIKTKDKNLLIIIALGPTATVLAYELSIVGFQAIDIGHIDIEYEWFLQKTKKKIPIKNKYVNELSVGQDVPDIDNQMYYNQIITSIL